MRLLHWRSGVLVGALLASVSAALPAAATPTPTAASTATPTSASPTAYSSTAPSFVNRLGGDDRYQTSAVISQARWQTAGGPDLPDKPVAESVVLARGDAFADALAGVPLAAYKKGPLLLTEPGSLTPVTKTEIERLLGPRSGKTIYVLGGPAAVAPSVTDALTADGYQVQRFAGADRYGTALDIAIRGLGRPKYIVIATGLDYADALAAGPLAVTMGDRGIPSVVTGAPPAAILLSSGNTFSDAGTRAYLEQNSQYYQHQPAPCTLWAVGGPAADALSWLWKQREWGNKVGCAPQLAGKDRYGTALAVATVTWHGGPIGVASGEAFADALTGGAYAASTGSAVLLTEPAYLPKVVVDKLNEWRVDWSRKDNPIGAITAFTVFGGTSAVSPFVADQLATYGSNG
ncbi:hypothetical protein GCM10009839_21780 [Catenulispora yoronensis]|uniref:Cell wall-binding repeat-containing protein n=1 Tax=Catenulispora yoronensis TaxID=450799 RepID=A0ABP5FG15_9ACTN